MLVTMVMTAMNDVLLETYVRSVWETCEKKVTVMTVSVVFIYLFRLLHCSYSLDFI
jgi:hypothetical protein